MNNQQVSKVVGQFRINHDFHDPYTLLLDGNFLALLMQKQLDITRKFTNLLTARVSLATTLCVLRELELLGNDYRLVYAKAKQCWVIHCKHLMGGAVESCLLEQVGDTNEKKFIVCSQDLELRRQLREVEAVPIMYFGPDQRVTMEDIHKSSLKQLEINAKAKLMPSLSEMPQILLYKEQQRLSLITKEKEDLRRRAALAGTKAITKIVKGPNPLSVKKKQSSPQNAPPAEKKKRIRKRKAKPAKQPDN